MTNSNKLSLSKRTNAFKILATPNVYYLFLFVFIMITSCNHNHRHEDQKMDEVQVRSLKYKSQINVAVYIHDHIEILDLAAPIEVFDRAGMNVFTVGLDTDLKISQGILEVKPEYSIEDHPDADIVVFVGGNGANAAKNNRVKKWIQKINPTTPQFFTVCTGAFFLAEAGLLKNKNVTTFHDAIEDLKDMDSEIQVLKYRFVDDGRIISTAGVSAGIDGALYLVDKLLGEEKVNEVIEYMEYPYWDKSGGHIIK
ncbi:DJ-1/PfpI family protein [Robiginitalea sp. IMCC44478]|uniref:DJ-1/PfpI family protein n=1 Tax=Robiginitalea sp. IMCC44478 TaxID=3459122 RepID=UPI00404138CD